MPGFATERTVKSASEYDYAPFSMVAEDNRADGFSVELLRAALRAMDRNVSFDVASWPEIKNNLITSKIDALPMVGRTPEREAIFDFTVPYIKLYGAVFVRQGDDSTKTFADLRDRRIGVMKGDNAEEFLKRENISKELVTSTSFKDSFLQLSRGDIDAVVAQRLVGLSLIKTLALDNVKVAIAPLKMFRQDFCFAVAQGNDELLAQLNEGLAVVIADGTYDKLHDKWLGVLDKPKRDLNQFWIIASCLIALAFIFMLVLYLRYKSRSRRQLQESGEQYRNLFENMSQGVFYQNQAGHITDCNQAALDIFGISRKQLLDKAVVDDHWKVIDENLEVIPVDLHPSIMALKTGKPVLAAVCGVYNKAKADYIWLNINAIPRFKENENKAFQVFVTLHEVTKLKRIEQRYHAIFEQAAVGLARVGVDGTWLEVNQKFCDIIGYNPDELAQLAFQDITYKADLAKDLDCMQKMLAGEVDVYTGEKRYIRKSGEPVWINVTLSLVHNEDNSPKYFIEVIEDIQLRKQAELALKLSEQKYSTLIEAAPLGLYETDAQGNCLYVNQTWQNISGLSQKEALGGGWRLGIHENDQDHIFEQWTQAIKEKKKWQSEYRFCTPQGKVTWVLGSLAALYDPEGEITGYIGANVDINVRKESEQKLQLAASVFTNAREGISITDADANIVDVNDAFTKITGFNRDELIGKNHKLLKSGRQGNAFYKSMWESLHNKGHWYGEIWDHDKSGEIFAASLTVSTVRDERNQIKNFVGIFTDITQQKENQKQLEHIAHFDALTQLPNRLLLADRLRQAMILSQRHRTQLAVVYLDLDGFKLINDEHGHDIGDKLLIKMAKRMKQTLREGDTISRIGGDEFVAVLTDLFDKSACIPLLTRLIDVAAEPVYIGEMCLQVSASLGVSFFSHEIDTDADTLLRQADQAMYQAKLAGKNRYHMFDINHDLSIRGQYESIEHIRLALIRYELVLHYQPKVNMRTGELIGVEGLIRWNNPKKGLLYPDSFIPSIENHPLAIELGEWVIKTALKQLQVWQDLGLELTVSVNISAFHLQQPDFVERLQKLVGIYENFRPGSFELEVLETSVLEDIVQTSSVIKACRNIGVIFSLDDFGTGYSSLSYLKRLPVSYLKIDRSFIQDMLDDPDDLSILEGVLGLSDAFALDTVAEGVETIEHGRLLLQLGCQLAQGYCIAKPMPAKELVAWYQHWVPDVSWQKQQTISRDDIPLIVAGIEHRSWIKNLIGCLENDCSKPLQLDQHQCRFGKWMHGEGHKRYSDNASFLRVMDYHEQAHTMAKELLTLKNLDADISGRISKLSNVKDGLIRSLDNLLDEVSIKH